MKSLRKAEEHACVMCSRHMVSGASIGTVVSLTEICACMFVAPTCGRMTMQWYYVPSYAGTGDLGPIFVVCCCCAVGIANHGCTSLQQ